MASLLEFLILAWIDLMRLFLLARCAVANSLANSSVIRLRSNLKPSEQVAVVFNPKSIPTETHPSESLTSTSTVVLKYHRPRASCEKEPVPSSYLERSLNLIIALGRRYLQYINTSYRRTGTLWDSRYKS
jgi:hypothetical protein